MTNLRTFFISALAVAVISSIGIPLLAHAENLVNPLQAGVSIQSFLNSILAFVVRIGTVVVILMLVLVGYKFVVAQGEPGKITEARQMLLWTIVGALILLGAQAIAIAVQATATAIGA